ncbi:hypothetical protein FACS189419_08560 [Planctomycetales bacterium]|nr:hypothetical protein FACS189419_08560 [Planctomycetales bacterium]
MKKVGIVTFHDEPNYGAILQTYALQETIRDLGHSPQIVGYNPTIVPQKWLQRRLTDAKSISLKLRIFLENILFASKVNRYKKECLAFFQKYYSCADKCGISCEELLKNPPDCDVFSVGSDQVWNPYVQCDKVYMLHFAAEHQKRISYGASFGVAEIPQELRTYYQESLAQFSAVSVRESAALTLLDSLHIGNSVKPKLVLDPTLLREPLDWENIISGGDSQTDLPPFPYILVYAHGKSGSVVRIAEHLKKKTGNNIVLVGPFRRSFFVRSFSRTYCVGPIGFLQLMKNARCVVTNTYHGTIFAYTFRRPFVTFLSPTNKGASRFHQIFDLWQLRSRLITGIDELPKDFENIDFDTAEKNRKAEKERSIAFLKEAIES